MLSLVAAIAVFSMSCIRGAREATATLPSAVRDAIAARGFRPVPGRSECNVFRGQFARRGQYGWAVFCAGDSGSRLYVSVDDSGKDIELVESWPLQPTRSDSVARCDFWRATPRVVQDYVQHLKDEPGQGAEVLPELAPIDHDGIEEGVGDVASLVYYRHGGRWLSFVGSD
jgi:hypothetical protein